MTRAPRSATGGVRHAARRARWIALTTACLTLSPDRAVADEAEPRADATRRRVEVRVAGSAGEARLLQASLAELLGRMGLELALTVVDGFDTPLASLPGAVVLARVDLREPGAAKVDLIRVGSPAALPPRRIPERESRALLLEETALVVYTGTEALLEEPSRPPTPVASSTGAPPPPPVPLKAAPTARDAGTDPATATRPSWLVEGAVLGSVQAYAKNGSAVPGFELGARGRFGRDRWLPAWWLLGGFHLPSTQTVESVAMTTSVWSLRFEPSLELARHAAWSFEAGLGAGADIAVITPTSSAPDAALTSDRHEVSAVLASLAAVSFATGPALRLLLGATLDYDLAPKRYVVVHGDTRSPLLETLPLRPALTLGFLFAAAGSEGEP